MQKYMNKAVFLFVLAGLFFNADQLHAQDSEPVVVWDVSLWGERRAFTEHVEHLAELVAGKTNGKFTLNLSYGGLSEPKGNLRGISSGKFEMAQFCAGFHRDDHLSISLLELPFLGVETLEQERYLSQWFYRHPAVVQEFERWNAILLMPSPLPQYNLVGIGPAPRTLQAFSGLSIRATGSLGKAIAAIRAIPTPTAESEVREALEEGFVEAVAFPPHDHMSFGTTELGHWWTANLNPGTVNCPVAAGVEAVKELAPQYRNALYESINEALDHYIANYNNASLFAFDTELNRRDIDKITFSKAEVKAFQSSVAGPAAVAWIKEHSDRGLPAQELYDYVTLTLDGGDPDLDSQFNKWAAAEVASTPVVETTFSAITVDEVNNYLGPPRNGARSSVLTADPLQYLVEWDLQGNVTVGDALSRLASYIGYELIGGGSSATQNNYKSLLPLVQRSVSEIAVGEGFEVLSGAGFVTVFDHSARSVTHLPRRSRQTKRNLPECPTDIGVASRSSEGVLILTDGSECRY